jgi:hypothetical protein
MGSYELLENAKKSTRHFGAANASWPYNTVESLEKASLHVIERLSIALFAVARSALAVQYVFQ